MEINNRTLSEFWQLLQKVKLPSGAPKRYETPEGRYYDIKILAPLLEQHIVLLNQAGAVFEDDPEIKEGIKVRWNETIFILAPEAPKDRTIYENKIVGAYLGRPARERHYTAILGRSWGPQVK